MNKTYSAISAMLLLTGCAGQTVHDAVSPVGQPVGVVLAAAKAPIQGATETLATQGVKTQENPYGR